MKISELLCDESKWCKGFMALDSNGNPVPSRRATAVKWCLLGAVIRCGIKGDDFIKLEKVIKKLYYLSSIPIFNDQFEFKDVQRVLKEANL